MSQLRISSKTATNRFDGDTAMKSIDDLISRLPRWRNGNIQTGPGGDDRDFDKLLADCNLELLRLKSLSAVAEQLRTQDNRITAHPIFCVQIKARDVGYDTIFTDNSCWYNANNEESIYDDDPDFKGEPEGDRWETYGYKDRWETVMVSFTEKGAEEYLRLNGHNDRRRAFRGEVRIYVDTLHRCPEMIAIREFLMGLP